VSQGDALAEAARGAFTEAVVLTASVSAALALAAAVAAAMLLRDVGARPATSEAPA
jgi:DHA2 family multidrug resistance protein-like MFS transporter